MVTELTEASTSVSKVDETPLTEPEAEPTEPEDQPTEPDAQPTEPNAQPIDSNKLFIIDWWTHNKSIYSNTSAIKFSL